MYIDNHNHTYVLHTRAHMNAYMYTRTYVVHTHPTYLYKYLHAWARRENKKKNM